MRQSGALLPGDRELSNGYAANYVGIRNQFFTAKMNSVFFSDGSELFTALTPLRVAGDFRIFFANRFSHPSPRNFFMIPEKIT
jgi:hypothetical protein